MAAGENILVVGVFDLFHRGHLELLKRAKESGTNLYVIVNGDKLTTAYKRKPIYSETDRLEIINSIGIVKDAIISNSFDVKPFIHQFNIDAIVHGDDWDHEAYLQQICCTTDYLSSVGVRMIYTPYYEGVSTSSIIKQIEQRLCASN